MPRSFDPRRVTVCPRPVIASVACLVCLVMPREASADTIHLENGHVIRTEDARIEGERVVFTLHGARQAIPARLVVRVVEDHHREAGPSRSPKTPNSDVPAPGAPAPEGTPAVQGVPQMIVESFGDLTGKGTESGGVDPAAALALLRRLGGPTGTGLESVLASLAGLGGDLEQAQMLIPALSRFARQVFSSDASEANASAAVDQLLQAFAAAGVSRSDLMARARSLGLPLDALMADR